MPPAYIDRREFIKTAGGIALASVLPAFGPALSRKSPRIVIFSEPSFPAGEIPLPSRTEVGEALHGFDVAFLSFKDAVSSRDADLFVNPYGSLFPKEFFPDLLEYLTSGGNWLNLGGIPFKNPVTRDGSAWRIGNSETAYHQKLGITQSFPVPAGKVTSFTAHDGAQALLGEFRAEEFYETYVRFASTKDFPDEDGTGGQRDALLKPLVHGVNDAGRKLVCPFLQVDRMQGAFAGGRWVLANFKGSISTNAVKVLAGIALEGSSELSAHSSLACYHEGERMSLSVRLHRPRGNVRISEKCQVEVRSSAGSVLERLSVSLSGTEKLATGTVDSKVAHPPGFYTVTASLGSFPQRSTGFWVYDRKLASAGKSFSTNGDYFLQENSAYPVTGTTYMASDVHRKFLFEANPAVWDRDFKEMKSSGINMVRTGIWTGWKKFMLDVGAPEESALRAMDAFVLTARKYDVPVIFTFFAFLPEMWGGVNPYLDPRAVDAQKEFVLSFVQRYRTTPGIFWDFINEPSFCNPQKLWECRPNGDLYEKTAWKKWLYEKYSSESDALLTGRLQEVYRTTADDALSLPTPEDFEDVNIFGDRVSLKVIDYRLFAQEMFARWTREMASTVKSVSGHLVTVGQDEGGTADRPSPQFFGDDVDFTCIHTWWLNDDLVWDQVMTRISGRPNLIEETGIMFYEKMDGSPWRSEADARDLLERKLAIALGAGGAGFIEWVWNTNPYMKSDNEAAIGLFRPDGTAKPELEPVESFARFFEANRLHMAGRVEEEVLMVIPHSQMFSTRDFSTEATQRCVRALTRNFQVLPSAISEYRLRPGLTPRKLIILPSPRVLNQNAWTLLLSFVEQGSTLLVTGCINSDEHWMPIDRLKEFGINSSCKPVSQEEFLTIGGTDFQLGFRGKKIERLEKGFDHREVLSTPHGKGFLIWAPVPIELSESPEPTTALYGFALEHAGVVPALSCKIPFVVLPTLFAKTLLITCVSDLDRDADLPVKLTESGRALTVHVPAQRSAVMFVNRTDGKILSHM